MTDYSHLPALYSLRNCPYAMRARLALYQSGQTVKLRDIVLSDKPSEMLTASPKATVPVLVLADSTVIEESLDIIIWALRQNDPKQLLNPDSELSETLSLIAENDGEFKHWLDHYKYATHHPEQSVEYYRQRGEVFLQKLEQRLTENTYLSGPSITVSDIAIVPFVRQFAHVDKRWFDSADYPALQRWLAKWLTSEVFLRVMVKVS